MTTSDLEFIAGPVYKIPEFGDKAQSALIKLAVKKGMTKDLLFPKDEKYLFKYKNTECIVARHHDRDENDNRPKWYWYIPPHSLIKLPKVSERKIREMNGDVMRLIEKFMEEKNFTDKLTSKGKEIKDLYDNL
jgi:hypothetical protein